MEGVTLPAVVIEGTTWSQNIKLKGQQDFGWPSDVSQIRHHQ